MDGWDAERRLIDERFRSVWETFGRIDRELNLVNAAPAQLAKLIAEVAALREDVRDAKTAAEGVQKVLLGFFSALLIVLVGAIVGVIVAV